MALLPIIPGDNIGSRLLLGLLVVIFGAFFVTVSSRIVGLIGSSNNPISGMTIATIMATCLVFIGVGWTGKVFEPMALVVGGMICVAAANAGATSQDLKTGYIVGATPKYQQLALFIGVIVSSIVIGWTVKILDTPSTALAALGVKHAIGETYSAPQATLMATIIKGILGGDLDWQFVMVGVFIAIVLELCNIKALSFAVGTYLPLATTLPIFVGGFMLICAVAALAIAFGYAVAVTVAIEEILRGIVLSIELVVKETQATFAATPEEQPYRLGVRTPMANLFLAGDWTDTGLPATLESAVVSGERAAAAAAGYLCVP